MIEFVSSLSFSLSLLSTYSHPIPIPTGTPHSTQQILILSSGRLLEFDSPTNLLQNKTGVFHQMCQESGDWEELMRLARRRRSGEGGGEGEGE